MHNRRVAMDGRMLGAAGTGVATYAHMLRAAQGLIADHPIVLIDRLPGIAAAPGRMRRVLAALRSGARQARMLPDEANCGGNFFAVDIFRIAQVHFNIHRQLLTLRVPGPPGIIHWTYPVPLRIAGWANLYTVHDAIPMNKPNLTPINARRHLRLLRCVTTAAARLVTVSNAARNEILAALDCPPDLIVNCAQAVDVASLPATAGPPLDLTKGSYLLVCGSVEPRKNIARLLEAYRLSGVTMPLVVAGPDGWRAGPLAAALAATPGVIRLPYLARGDLLAFIANARALLMPSLAEGFGLPVAEALALGVPAVTSAGGALAETAGGAALLVDPASVAEIANAIRRIVDDDALRAALAAAGPAAATRFTVPRFAARLAGLYDAVIAEAH